TLKALQIRTAWKQHCICRSVRFPATNALRWFAEPSSSTPAAMNYQPISRNLTSSQYVFTALGRRLRSTQLPAKRPDRPDRWSRERADQLRLPVSVGRKHLGARHGKAFDQLVH